MLSRFNRPLFKVLRPVEIASWHQIGSSSHSVFLRGLTNELLVSQASGAGMAKQDDHRFASDRLYWLSRPAIPGSFEAGVATLEKRPYSARVVLGLFLPKSEEPVLLYVADRLSIDSAGRPAAPGAALEAAMQATAAGFKAARFGLSA
eukprot:gb/GFBE01006170.1/.p1 GENE.gb/GFBE01006170.1/~~gb/GFBE01006170.1/.p1  ORF type:complete len:148 (+),score=16.99 gb/GFBE01006170.1/:1-444(+)